MLYRWSEVMVRSLLVLGILMVGSACRLVPAPTLAPAPLESEPQACPKWLIRDQSAELPFEHAAESSGPARVDPGRRWLAASTGDGVAVYRLSDGREVALEPWPSEPGVALEWAWSSESGRLVLLTTRPTIPRAIGTSWEDLIEAPHETTLVELDPETGERSTSSWSSDAAPVLRSIGPLHLGPRAQLVFGRHYPHDRPGTMQIAWLDAHGNQGSWSMPASGFAWSADATFLLTCNKEDATTIHWRTTGVAPTSLPPIDCEALGEQTILFRGGDRLGLLRAGQRFSSAVSLSYEGEAYPDRDAVKFDAEERQVAWEDAGVLRINDTSTGELLLERELEFELGAIAHVEPECGLLLVDLQGRRRWLPTTAGEPERSVGIPALPTFRSRIEAGSLAGELVVSNHLLTQWSEPPIFSVLHWKRAGGQALTSREVSLDIQKIDYTAGETWFIDDTLVSNGIEGWQRVWPEPAGQRIAWPHVEAPGDWVQHRSTISPDARWLLAISSVYVQQGSGGTTPSGRMHMYDLRDDSLTWSATFEPHVTALAMTDEALWIAEGPRSHVHVEAHRLADLAPLHFLEPEGLEGRAILALRPAGERIYGLLEPSQAKPNSALIAWTADGHQLWSVHFDRPSLPFEGLDDIYAGRDLEGRWLRVASDGAHLIIERPGALAELWSVSGDPIRVHRAKQLAFGDDPDTLLAEVAQGRFEAWSIRTGERRWTVQLDGDGNAHFRPD